MLAFAAVSTPALLTACTTVDEGGPVYIDVSGDNACFVEAAGRRFALPAEGEALATQLRGLARQSDSALMSAPPALTRPGCWDEAVALVQAAGFRRIGFIVEDPDPSDVRDGWAETPHDPMANDRPCNAAEPRDSPSRQRAPP